MLKVKDTLEFQITKLLLIFNPYPIILQEVKHGY